MQFSQDLQTNLSMVPKTEKLS